MSSSAFPYRSKSKSKSESEATSQEPPASAIPSKDNNFDSIQSSRLVMDSIKENPTLRPTWLTAQKTRSISESESTTQRQRQTKITKVQTSEIQTRKVTSQKKTVSQTTQSKIAHQASFASATTQSQSISQHTLTASSVQSEVTGLHQLRDGTGLEGSGFITSSDSKAKNVVIQMKSNSSPFVTETTYTQVIQSGPSGRPDDSTFGLLTQEKSSISSKEEGSLRHDLISDVQESQIQNILKSLDLQKYYPSLLGMKDLKKLRRNDSEKTSERGIWTILHELCLPPATVLPSEGPKQSSDSSITSSFDSDQLSILALFLCSDHIVRGHMAQLLQKHRLPIPFVMPITNEIMLWPTRTAASMHGTCLADIKLPLISVIQLGEQRSRLSSELLNATFDQKSAFSSLNEPRKKPLDSVSDGMVELNYCALNKNKPGGFSQPLLAANLLGNGTNFSRQVQFVPEISDVVCILTKSLDLVSDYLGSFGHDKRVLVCISNQEADFALAQDFVLRYNVASMKIATFGNIGEVKDVLVGFVNDSMEKISPRSLGERTKSALKYGLKLDEEEDVCKKTKLQADKVFDLLKKEVQFTLKQCILDQNARRKKDRSVSDASISSDDSSEESSNEHEEIAAESIPEGFKAFLQCLRTTEGKGRSYFLQWLNVLLEMKPQQDLSTKQGKKIKGIKTIEALLQEMAYYWALMSSTSPEAKGEYSWLPQIAAELLLEGYPIKVVDREEGYFFAEWMAEIINNMKNPQNNDAKIILMSLLGRPNQQLDSFFKSTFGTIPVLKRDTTDDGIFLELLQVDSTETEGNFVGVLYQAGNLDGSSNAGLDQEVSTFMTSISDIVMYTLRGEEEETEADLEQLCLTYSRVSEVEAWTRPPACILLFQKESGELQSEGTSSYSPQKLQDKLNQQIDKVLARKPEKRVSKSLSNLRDLNENKLIMGLPKISGLKIVSTKEGQRVSDEVEEISTLLLEKICTKRYRKFSKISERVSMVASSLKVEHVTMDRDSLKLSSDNLSDYYTTQKTRRESKVENWVKRTESKILSLEKPGEEEKQTLMEKGQKKINKEMRKLSKRMNSFKESRKGRVETEEEVNEEVEQSILETTRKLSVGMLNAVQKTFEMLEDKLKSLDTSPAKSNGFLRGMERLEVTSQRTDIGDLQKQTKLENDFNKLCEIYFERDFPPDPIMKVDAQKTLQLCLQEHFADDTIWLPEVTHPSLLYDISSKDVCSSRMYRWTVGRYEWLEWVTGNLRWMGSHQNLSDKILRECGRDLQSLTSKPGILTEDHCETLIRHVEARIAANLDKSIPWSDDYKKGIMQVVCNASVTFFEQMQENYENAPDYRDAVKETKDGYFQLLTGSKKSEDYETVFCQEIISGVLTNLRKSLPVTITECLKEEKQELFNIERVYEKLLSFLKQKDKFRLYLSYLSDFKDFATTWIRMEILEFLEEEVGESKRFYNIMMDKVTKTLETFQSVIEESLREASRDYKYFLKAVWIKTMSRNVPVGFDDRCLRRLEYLDVKNLERFGKHIKKRMKTEVVAQIRDKVLELNIEKEIRNSEPSIEEQIHDVLMCTEGAQCPFCAAPCTKLGPHKVHHTVVHYPQGVNGYRDCISKKLVHRNCYESFASQRRFKNEITRGEAQPYKCYRSIHPEWDIQKDQYAQVSHFWKIFFSTYNQQLANHYGCHAADIPKDWMSLQNQS